MSKQKSKIEWCDVTWSTATGCTRVSLGCGNCYMFAMYPKLHSLGIKGYEFHPGRVQTIPERLKEPYTWTTPKRVFVNSMSDTFHVDVGYDFALEMFKVMADCNRHTYMLLTKRPARARKFWQLHGHEFDNKWPSNIWMGTSVETERFTNRLDVLAEIPAEIRFVSAEPLLGDVNLEPYLADGILQWVIVGGESGRNARPMQLDWARQIRDDCIANDVSFFLKQLGGNKDKHGGLKAKLDGRTWTQIPVTPQQGQFQMSFGF